MQAQCLEAYPLFCWISWWKCRVFQPSSSDGTQSIIGWFKSHPLRLYIKKLWYACYESEHMLLSLQDWASYSMAAPYFGRIAAAYDPNSVVSIFSHAKASIIVVCIKIICEVKNMVSFNCPDLSSNGCGRASKGCATAGSRSRHPHVCQCKAIPRHSQASPNQS